MPNVASAGTYSYSDGQAYFASTAGSSYEISDDWSFLGETTQDRMLLFGGTSIGGGCTIKYKDDTGTAQDAANNTVSAVATDKYLMTRRPLDLVFTGTPNCNVTLERLLTVTRPGA